MVNLRPERMLAKKGLAGRVRAGARVELRLDGGERAFGADGLEVALLGSIGERGELDRALDRFGSSDAELLLAAFSRFGSDAFARVAGPYVAALSEPATGRVLIAAQPGSPLPLFLWREAGAAAFATDFISLAAGRGELAAGRGELAAGRGSWTPDLEAVEAFVAGGFWVDAGRSLFREVEIVAPGTMAVIEKSGRVRRRPFYNFSPFTVPREMSAAEARAEVDRAVGRAIARAALLADGPVVVVAECEARGSELARRLPRTSKLSAVAAPRGAAADGARFARGPLSAAALGEVAGFAALARAGGATNFISDLGARELFGETARGRAALRGAIARAFEANPGARAAIAAVRGGAARQLGGAAAAVLRRWSRHLPEARREVALRWLPEEVRPFGQVAEVTGNLFVDVRFAEVTDPSTRERHRASALAVAETGGTLIAPYLDPEVIETMFSLQAQHFLPASAPSSAARGEDVAEAAADRRRGIELILDAHR